MIVSSNQRVSSLQSEILVKRGPEALYHCIYFSSILHQGQSKSLMRCILYGKRVKPNLLKSDDILALSGYKAKSQMHLRVIHHSTDPDSQMHSKDHCSFNS